MVEFVFITDIETTNFSWKSWIGFVIAVAFIYIDRSWGWVNDFKRWNGKYTINTKCTMRILILRSSHSCHLSLNFLISWMGIHLPASYMKTLVQTMKNDLTRRQAHITFLVSIPVWFGKQTSFLFELKSLYIWRAICDMSDFNNGINVNFVSFELIISFFWFLFYDLSISIGMKWKQLFVCPWFLF